MNDSPSSKDFSRYPMLFLAVYFAAGIFLSRADLPVPIVVPAGTAIIAAVFLVRRPVLTLAPLIFVPLGFLVFQLEIQSVGPERVRAVYASGSIQSFEPVELTGTVIGFPEPAPDGSYLRLEAQSLVHRGTDRAVSGTIRLFISEVGPAEEIDPLRHGSIVRIACRLEREERYLNPGVASRVEILDQQGIDAVGSIKSSVLIEKLGHESIFLPVSWMYELRGRLITAFRTHLSSATSGVMIASLLGDKHFLDRETAEVFREGGTFHVLVISGLHITFIGGLTLWVVSIFTRRAVWRTLLPVFFLWGYTLAVGAEIPVVRASLMFTTLLVFRLFYRDASSLNALGLCVLVLLIWRPSDLFSASFQLTFVSVVAIVGCAFPVIEHLRLIGSWTPSSGYPLPPNVSKSLRRFCELLYWNDAEWRIAGRRNLWTAGLFKSPYLGWLSAPNVKSALAYMFEGLLVSMIVQLWMLPFSIVYFHRVPPASLFLNLWVGIFLALESFAAVGGVGLATFSSWLAAPLFALTEALNDAMMFLPRTLAGVESLDFRVPVYTAGLSAVYALYFLTIAAMAIRIHAWMPFALIRPNANLHSNIFLSLAALCLAAVIVLTPFSDRRPDGTLRIEFLDVGQGDSALVTFPDGQTMLVDGGGLQSFDSDGDASFEPDRMRIGEAVVSEFLWEMGYSRIDYVVASHADADHMQGLVDVAGNFTVGALLLSDISDRSSNLIDLLAVAERKSIPVDLVAAGDRLNIAGVEIGVLHPGPGTRSSSNNRSIVLRLEFGATVVLLTGDIESGAEQELSAAGRPGKVNVMKVPHHGSRTSSTLDFVQSSSPEIAIISVGRRSRFGHPHPDVVNRWINTGADVRTTGDHGTITVSSDGSKVEIKTFLE